jgi:protein-S-isoprenylcysteine O-methyltransferase Ste14
VIFIFGERLKSAMSRTAAALGSVLFFFAAPCVAGGLIPWWFTHWHFKAPFSGFELFSAIGAGLIMVGLLGVIDSFGRFAWQGRGTPAPVAPPEKLVVTGLYRYVRNPMYVAILAVIFGQALLFGEWRLIVYGALLWLAFHFFVVAYEEPRLEKTFGVQYRAFRTHVPRWIPRLAPWRDA